MPDKKGSIFKKKAKEEPVDAGNLKYVGQSVKKVDGLGLATGIAGFVDDIELPNLLYAKILPSPHAHAKILSIDASKAKKLKGVKAVLTYKDLPRIAHTTAGQGYPEPSPYDTFILDNKVRYVGDRVAAVAAETEQIAEEAIKLIKVQYKVLKPVLDMEKATEKGMPIIHDEKEARTIIPLNYDPKRNIASQVKALTGNMAEGFSNADHTFENIYYAHYASHAANETHIVITYLDGQGRLVIRTSTQVPFHVRRIVAERLQLSESRVRVIKPRIGGGFGGKQEVLIEDICSALTLKTRSPVKLHYSRSEEFIASRTRHPQRIILKTGVKHDGTITAIDMDVLMNTGAYGSHALTVACNTGSKVLPLLRCENVQFKAQTVYTNLPVGGAYRGYGATQGYIAMGIQVDEMAERIGMDVCHFYKMNHIKVGETSPVFKALGEGREGVLQTIESCGLDQCIEIGATAIDWYAKKERYERQTGQIRKGVGMVALMQGSSIPDIDMGAASMKMNEDGSFNLLVGATDLGTGSDTILAQMAAEVLDVPVEKIIVYSSDTDLTPFDVGAYASSTTYLSGYAVIKTAEDIRSQIFDVAAEMLKEKKADLYVKDSAVFSKKTGKNITYQRIGLHSLYEKNQHQIASVKSHITHKSPPPFSAHFVEIELDMDTGKVKVLKYVAAIECGRAINPKLAEGQTEGGVLNGISYALTEEYIFDRQGRMLNSGFDNYKLFYPADLPEIRTILIEGYPEPTGPYGAKSVSEICINGAVPAISNAIYNAVGIRLRKPPFTPEVVYTSINK
ncbi:MAG: molybdopterin-dependent oxidoreductase [Spirochaetes bacterium]|nr:molybdopterin-dependent oxidoreductase [Spirochaetota bacterium]